MALCVDMLRLTGDPDVADELEISTLNATLGAQSPSGRWWTYNTPMDGVRRASAHDIVFQAREGTPELNCCSVNGPRSLGMLAQWAVMRSGNRLALNYYGASTITIPYEAGQMTLRQTTDYPRSGKIEIAVDAEGVARDLTVGLRVPAWSRHTTISRNGSRLPSPTPGSYVWLDGPWHTGNRVTLDLDMNPRFSVGEREVTGKVSLYRGPLLLAYDRWLNAFDPDDVPPIAIEELTLASTEVSRPVAQPWVAFEARTTDGRRLVLCDFASAGAAGTPYRTWLPLVKR